MLAIQTIDEEGRQKYMCDLTTGELALFDNADEAMPFLTNAKECCAWAELVDLSLATV